jgi:hypothetical protein
MPESDVHNGTHLTTIVGRSSKHRGGVSAKNQRLEACAIRIQPHECEKQSVKLNCHRGIRYPQGKIIPTNVIAIFIPEFGAICKYVVVSIAITIFEPTIQALNSVHHGDYIPRWLRYVVPTDCPKTNLTWLLTRSITTKSAPVETTPPPVAPRNVTFWPCIEDVCSILRVVAIKSNSELHEQSLLKIQRP